MSRLHGVQYVRLAPGAAEAVARYVNTGATEIDELVLDLRLWPDEIRPSPRRARDGRLLAGDPVLLDATDAGLVFSGGSSPPADPILVSWRNVREMQVLNAQIPS